MQHNQVIKCRYCESDDIVKNGCTSKGMQRWRCKKCGKYFQLDYKYNAWAPGVKEKIIELTLNSCGVRDIGRTLQINKNTVISELKKNAKNKSIHT